jgi:hypothetical protein
MSVRSLQSVYIATAVAGAALGCYLVSLRVASERAALEQVEAQIVRTQSQIRLLQTEIGTRGRLAQLERWNVRALSLSAPSADQILGDKFQLARLIQPEHKLDVTAPVVLASAPAPQPQRPLEADPNSSSGSAPMSQLLHEASLTVAVREAAPPPTPAPSIAAPKPVQATGTPAVKKVLPEIVGDKKAKAETAAVTRPVRTAKIDPLAPLPGGASTAKRTRSDR